MKQAGLSDGEWKLMNLLWEQSPRTLGEMVEAMKEDTGWSKSTIYVMLKRMLEKHSIEMREEHGLQKYYPLLNREKTAREESRNFLSKVYKGSLSMMVASLVGQDSLSEQDIEELKEVLKKAEKKGLTNGREK